MVLIVAKCNVNINIPITTCTTGTVLIVAKCNVNMYECPLSLVPTTY